MVSLPRKDDPPELGESRTTAVRWFLRNEKSLRAKGKLEAFQQVLQEYLDLGHVEIVPPDQLSGPTNMSYYLPVHGVVQD